MKLDQHNHSCKSKGGWGGPHITVYIYIYMWTSLYKLLQRQVHLLSAVVAVAVLAGCAAVAAIVAHRVPPKCDDDWSQGRSLKSTACVFAVLLDSL